MLAALSLKAVAAVFRPRAKAHEPLASLPHLRPQHGGDRQLQHSRALALAQPPPAPEDVIAAFPARQVLHPAPPRIKAHTHPGFRAIEKADIIRVRSGVTWAIPVEMV